MCCLPILPFLHTGGSCSLSLFLSLIFPWHLPQLPDPPAPGSCTAQHTQSSRKLCQGLGKPAALWLPEPSLWGLNGGSVLGVHDTTLGMQISAGKGHRDPWGCGLDRRQHSATDTKVNGNLNREIFFPERRRLNLIPWEVDLACIRKQRTCQPRCSQFLAGRPLGPTQVFFSRPQKSAQHSRSEVNSVQSLRVAAALLGFVSKRNRMYLRSITSLCPTASRWAPNECICKSQGLIFFFFTRIKHTGILDFWSAGVTGQYVIIFHEVIFLCSRVLAACPFQKNLLFKM